MCFLALGLWLAPLTILGPGFERMPGEACDSGFSSVVLEHGFKWLTGQEASYLDAPFLYPFKKSITLSDNFLSTLPVYSLFRLAGIDREGAYQLWFLSLFVLNFMCARWALARLGHSPELAALGAFLFAFLSPVLEEVTHPALLHLFPIPLAVCGFILWAETGSTRAFAGMCAAVVLQFYGAFYLGSFLVLALFLLGVSWLATHRGIAGIGNADNDGVGKSLLVAGFWLAGAALALLPLVLPYLETSQANGLKRFWTDVAPQLPTLGDLFRASPGNFLWGWTSDPSQVRSFNNVMHLGLLPWLGLAVCCAAMIRKRSDKRIAAVLLTVLLLAALTLRVGDFSLFKFIQWLPAFQSMRALTRVVLVESFLVILAFLWAAKYALDGIRSPRLRFAAFGCLCLLAVLDQRNTLMAHYGYDKAERRKETAQVRGEMQAAIAQAGAAGPPPPGLQGGPVAYLPAPQDAQGDCRATVAAMLAAQDLERPVVNAYSSWFPRGYGFYWDSGCRELRRWMLFTQSASDAPLFTDLVLAGPGAAGAFSNSNNDTQGNATLSANACLPVPSDREAARSELLAVFARSGEKDALAWAINASGFSQQGDNELWMGRTGALTLRAGESLTLEGVSFVPLDVRISVDAKNSGKMSFSGLPTRMTLAPSKTTRYEFTADKAFTSYGGAFSPAFPEVSVIFTSVRFQQAQPSKGD